MRRFNGIISRLENSRLRMSLLPKRLCVQSEHGYLELFVEKPWIQLILPSPVVGSFI